MALDELNFFYTILQTQLLNSSVNVLDLFVLGALASSGRFGSLPKVACE